MKYVLYGDGIHDDQPAIQEMIDSGVCEVALPAPKCRYLISAPLVLPSDFKLALPRYAEIRLMAGSNCVMLRNKWEETEDSEQFRYEGRDKIWSYANFISADAEHRCKNITVEGGIWNFNNMEQAPNPLRSLDFLESGRYSGFGFQFFNVEGLKISSLTLKDPVTFGVTIDIVSYFTVEDITFDYKHGNPMTINMDGIHVNGNCHFGSVRNLKGACFDDLVALNDHEGYRGDITNVVIDGIYAEGCHSAVRLLAIEDCIRNVHITNVFGTYYQYCIGISKFYDLASQKAFDGITIDNVYASKAPRVKEVFPYTDSYVYPLVWIQGEQHLGEVTIRNLRREERVTAIPTLFIGENTVVENLILDGITQINELDEGFAVIHNKGCIKSLSMRNIVADKDEVLLNEGTVMNIRE